MLAGKLLQAAMQTANKAGWDYETDPGRGLGHRREGGKGRRWVSDETKTILKGLIN